MSSNIYAPGAIALAAALVGCATSTFTDPLSLRSEPDGHKAVVYGRFFMDGVSGIHAATNNYASIGMKFSCDGGTGFTIGLVPGDAERALQVSPGVCSLKTVAFTNGMSGRPMDERAYPGPALQSIRLTAGSMHYLGDFVGSYSNAASGQRYTLNWKLSAPANRFADTTKQVLTRHATLAAWPRTDVLGPVPAPVVQAAR